MTSGEASIEGLGALVQALEGALVSAFPGVRVIERDLALPGHCGADLVAVDEGGRLVLVLAVDGQAESTCLQALDLLAHARAHMRLLVRHLNDSQIRPDLEPRVFLVAESFQERLRSRLAPLLGERILLLEIRSLSSARGEATYLVPLEPPPLAAEPRQAAVEDFLGGLASEGRLLAGSAIRRLQRIDQGLECGVTREEVLWRHRGQLLCSLKRIDGRLEGHLPKHGQPLELVRPEELELFLERSLERYVELARGEVGEAEPELSTVELTPVAPGPILTPEEIRAFQD